MGRLLRRIEGENQSSSLKQPEGRRGLCEAHPKEVCRCKARDAPVLWQSSFSLPTVAGTSFSNDCGRAVIPLLAFPGQAGSLPTFYEVKHSGLYFCFPQRPEADPSAALEALQSALSFHRKLVSALYSLPHKAQRVSPPAQLAGRDMPIFVHR